jgi:hypothetical protein
MDVRMSDILSFPAPKTTRLEVREADPSNPPTPPLSAHAMVIQDVSGRIICYAWVAPEVDQAAFHLRAHTFRDALARLLAMPRGQQSSGQE